MNLNKIFNKNNTIIFVGILTLWRIFLAESLDLHPDEAYYWLWSKNLDFSYFDHPPMVAYFVKMTTLFWNSEFWVRFSCIIVSVLLSIITWRFSNKLFTSQVISSANVFLINLYPVTMTGSVIITPDVPAFLFWALCVYFAWSIIEQGKILYWYMIGIFFGLALLSKYTTVLFAPLFFIYLLLTEDKKWLKTVHPYLAFLISLILFLPVVLWNVNHNWISFNFQLGHGLGGQSYSLMDMLEFLGSQLLVIGPFVWIIGLVVSIIYLYKRNNDFKRNLFLIIMSIPVVLFFVLASLKRPGEANWPVLAYFSFTFLVTGYLLDGSKIKNIIWFIVLITNFAMCSILTLHTKYAILPLEKISKNLARIDATNWFYGWKELAHEIDKYKNIDFIITPSHQLSAMISYQIKNRIPVLVDGRISRANQFNIWDGLIDTKGKNGLYISLKRNSTSPYNQIFKYWEQKDHLPVYRNHTLIRTYKIIWGRS